MDVPDSLDHSDLHDAQLFAPAPGRYTFLTEATPPSPTPSPASPARAARARYGPGCAAPGCATRTDG